MVESTEQEITTYHVATGELLAQGKTNEEILVELQEVHTLTYKEAQTVLRGVYDSWASVKLGLSIQSEDLRNWHQYLRLKLLQKTLNLENVAAYSTALRILDSLATVQNVLKTIEHVVPLPILLVDAEVEAEEQAQAQETE